MFEVLQPRPADAILRLIAEFKDDSRSNKIDLGVGVYRTVTGDTPVLQVVKRAEQHLLETQTTKAYIGTAGNPMFNNAMQDLTFADTTLSARLAATQAPGGSGSLRVGAELLLRARKNTATWVSDPTWANHVPLLGGAGLELKPFPYYDTQQDVLRIDAMLDCLRSVPKGDVVVLHACCHNPTGLDPSHDEWCAIGDVCAERELLPFIDMAYQGFAADLDTDAFAVRHLATRVPEMIVSNSCSKNFGLYRDRVGCLFVLSHDRAARDTVSSNLSNIVRTIYSMPPDHGAAIVSTILNDPELTANWHVELAEMRNRLRDMRELLHSTLGEKAPQRDFSHLVRGAGMFCYLGVNETQVERLKAEFGIYMVGSSRINVAGITTDNVEYFADSVAKVL